MAKFTVEYKQKGEGGFTHSKRVVEDFTNMKGVLPDGLFADDLEFLVIRKVVEKPVKPVKPEVKK